MNKSDPITLQTLVDMIKEEMRNMHAKLENNVHSQKDIIKG